ncbi:MAG: gamma carbonic anhydrase family protein [Syntrophorhabdaceae bacterium]|nr:gamma carbonic anhydrase family protein [Syntrophorhabdaceae bacterium]
MLYGFDGKRPFIGKKSYVSETAILIGDVKIGDNCYIGHGAILRGDYGRIEIGDSVVIEEGVIIHAPPDEACTIEERAVIGHGAIIHAKRVGKNAGVGMGAVLSIRSEVGDMAVVAEGTVVKQKQKVKEKTVVAGNPARKIRDIDEKDREFWSYSNRLYMDLAKRYLLVGLKKIEE